MKIENKYTDTKWNEETVNDLADDLIAWMLEERTITGPDGMELGKVDAGNVFWKEFLYKNKLYDSTFNYLANKFESFGEKLEIAKAIQEHKLQKLSFEGKGKEAITKFILANKYGWKEKAENTNQNTTQISWNEIKTYTSGSK